MLLEQLFLMPVNLERLSVRKRFRLSYTGDDIEGNLSLTEKLKSDFKITLPEINDLDLFDIEAYFNEVESKIIAQPRWKVERNEIVLGFFSFGKFLMYRDLDGNNWPDEKKPHDHAIIKALLTDGFLYESTGITDDADIDELVSPADCCIVKDADSSQILAIQEVKAGRNLVIQGPPGTGKSQTITNLISEAVGQGKKVLFVSEKMAALEVVKRRLDEVGLGDAVLELHSQKTRKLSLIKELDRTLNAGRPLAKDTGDDIQALSETQRELNAYCNAVNTPILNTRTTPIQAIGRLLGLGQDVFQLPRFDFGLMKDWSQQEYKQKRLRIEQLILRLREIGTPKNHPFWRIGRTSLMPGQQEKLKKAIEKAQDTTGKLVQYACELADTLMLEEPKTFHDVETTCRAGRVAVEAPPFDGVCVSDNQWRQRCDDIKTLLAAGQALSSLHSRYDEYLIDAAWDQDMLQVREYLCTYGKKWWRIFSSKYRQARSRLAGLCKQEVPKQVTRCIELVDAVLDANKQKQLFEQHRPLGKQLFGTQWQDEKSDWEKLGSLCEWITQLYQRVDSGELPAGIIAFVASTSNTSNCSEQIDRVSQLLSTQHDQVGGIGDYLKCSTVNSRQADSPVRKLTDFSFTEQLEILGRWLDNLDQLPSYVQYNSLQAELIDAGLKFVLPRANVHPNAADVGRIFDATWYEGLIHHAFAERPALNRFNCTNHEYHLKKFRELDNLIIENNRARLALLHWQNIPSLEHGDGELAIVKREVHKKRRHLPIRKLMESAGRAIQAIKPILMMGPLSIAKYLPAGKVEFDLVIFDEASQVKPVDAFGAVLRGRQAVVVGDSKQLPPTKFFDVLISDDEEFSDESVVTSDLESILGLFCAQNAPERMLKWHYRSRHESLIAVSNYEFYQNQLLVFPSAGQNTSSRGLVFKHLPHTHYDRGKSKRNVEEAKAVAEAVMAHATSNPEQTLGVAAFSTAQRDAIDLHLELLRRRDTSGESFFSDHPHEPFFVKNLENVQGDERDVILISVGYGRTKEGQMSMHFGPLNQDGGERRLNVLISRARQTCIVFANFTANDLDLRRTEARGVRALKSFLAYAENGILETESWTADDAESPFEEEVIRNLQELGYELKPQVGVAGYRIDIGVIDKNKPGRYLLGIECDGASYHSARSARDRDRLRQQVLENLGWRIHRVWSTDWFRDFKTELKRVVDAIEKAKLYWECYDPTPNNSAKVHASDELETILRTEETPQTKDAFIAEPYVKVILPDRLQFHNLLDMSTSVLASCVEKVVQVESPVHVENVMSRIAGAAGVSRVGTRIRRALEDAIDLCQENGKIRIEGDFLWDAFCGHVRVRDRSAEDNDLKRIDRISPAEIALAMKEIVKRSFTIQRKDLISNAFRLIGIKRVTANAEEMAVPLLDQLIQEKFLTEDGGLISLNSEAPG